MDSLDRPSGVYLLTYLTDLDALRMSQVSKKWLDFTTGTEILWKQFFDRKFGGEPDYDQLVASKPKCRHWKEHNIRMGMTVRLDITFYVYKSFRHLTPEAIKDINKTTQYKRLDKHTSWFYNGKGTKGTMGATLFDSVIDQMKRKLHIIILKGTWELLGDRRYSTATFDCHLGFKGQHLPFNIPAGIPNVHGDRSYMFFGTLSSPDGLSYRLEFSPWKVNYAV